MRCTDLGELITSEPGIRPILVWVVLQRQLLLPFLEVLESLLFEGVRGIAYGPDIFWNLVCMGACKVPCQTGPSPSLPSTTVAFMLWVLAA
jgi:hypothetical protein